MFPFIITKLQRNILFLYIANLFYQITDVTLRKNWKNSRTAAISNQDAEKLHKVILFLSFN